MTDVDVAAQIFAELRRLTRRRTTPRRTRRRTAEDEHTLMQRASDIDFLRRLARRTGRWCRVVCGEHARTAHRLLRHAQTSPATPPSRST